MTDKAAPTRTAKPSSTTSPVRFGVAERLFAPPVPWTGVNHEAAAPDVAPLPVFHFGKIPIQAKLTVGPEGDAFEKEADATAERVMRMPDSAAKSGGEDEDEDEKELRREKWEQLHPGDAGRVQRKCDTCAMEDEGEKLQRKAAGGAVAEKVAPAIVHEVLRSPGAPLDAGTRAFLEPRFGRDFGGVRVHADARAAASATAVGAQAYTVGPDIVFGEGRYAPGEREGKRLLAHELSHVAQQGAAGPHAPGRTAPASPRVARAPASDVDPVHEKDAHEQQADAVADAVAARRSAAPLLDAAAPAAAELSMSHGARSTPESDAYEQEADAQAAHLLAGWRRARPVSAVAGTLLQRTPSAPNLSEPSVLAVVDKALESKGIAYATEVKMKITVTDASGTTISATRRLDRVFNDAGDWILLEGKGADPNSLTANQRLVDKIAQERGGIFEILEAGGKPPTSAAVRTQRFTVGFKATFKPGTLHYVTGRVTPTTQPGVVNSMNALDWRSVMNERLPDVAPSDDARYTRPNVPPTRIPQGDVPNVTPPPKPRPPTIWERARPLKPPMRTPPPSEDVMAGEGNLLEEGAVRAHSTPPPAPDEFAAGQAAGQRIAPAGPRVVTGQRVANALGEGEGEAGLAGSTARALEGDAAVAGAEAEALAAGGALAKGLRIGGNVALVVGTYALQKYLDGKEQERVQADLAKIGQQVDARVSAMSDAILDYQLDNPWTSGSVRVVVTERTRVTVMFSSWGASSSHSTYEGTTLKSTTFVHDRATRAPEGPGSEVGPERQVSRASLQEGELSGSVSVVDQDRTYLMPCRKLSYDELIEYVTQKMARLPDDQRAALQAKLDKLRGLKAEAKRQAEREKQKRERELIEKMEAEGDPPLAGVPPDVMPTPARPRVDQPASPFAPPKVDRGGPLEALQLPQAPQAVERERVDYLFAKRDQLMGTMASLKPGDRQARLALVAERDLWNERLRYLAKRLKEDPAKFGAELNRLGELRDWTKNAGRVLFEIPSD